MTVVSKRERKYPFRMQHVPERMQDDAWKCETCTNVTENPESRWCLSCRMYWEDVRDGVFDRDV